MNIIQPKMEGFMEKIYFHLKNYYFTKKKILRNVNFYTNVFLKNKFILFLIYISFYNFLQF